MTDIQLARHIRGAKYLQYKNLFKKFEMSYFIKQNILETGGWKMKLASDLKRE